VPLAGSDDDNANLAESMPGSLASATYLQIVSERRNLRFVPIDGVMPSLAEYEGGAYRYGKTITLVSRISRSGAAERFIAFLRTDEASRFMRDAGLIPMQDD
jgi:hypothetical protein